MSTVEGYRLLDRMQRVSHSPHTLSHFLTELYSGSPQRLALVLKNDFELVAENFAWFKEAKAQLQQAGALKTFLCGSGSTVAALVVDAAAATKVAAATGGIATHVLT
jgi:4-diphosphocytidyl-2C-methyl-D-erythritol kinase